MSRETVRPSASGFVLVAIGAALWGTDALFRRGLALELPANVIVTGEHLILVALLLPATWRARHKLSVFRWPDWVSLIVIGAGSSALATVMFTAAFSYGDPNTPLLLQKLQPVFAVVGAALILGERMRGRFFAYLGLAMVGAFLITFPNPGDITAVQLIPGLLAVGAALLWAMGTVLGRRLTPILAPTQLTGFRVTVGLAVLIPVAAYSHGATFLVESIANSIGSLLLLALVPGLLALIVYYQGLSSTPASAASVAELGFPLTAIAVNYFAFDAVLTGSQWLGVGLLSGTILVMAWVGRRSNGVARIGVVPESLRAPRRVAGVSE